MVAGLPVPSDNSHLPALYGPFLYVTSNMGTLLPCVQLYLSTLNWPLAL